METQKEQTEQNEVTEFSSEPHFDADGKLKQIMYNLIGFCNIIIVLLTFAAVYILCLAIKAGELLGFFPLIYLGWAMFTIFVYRALLNAAGQIIEYIENN